MTWTDIGELIKVIGALVTACAAATGGYVAWQGLDKWRKETTGKRRGELASAALADIYRMEQILRGVRSPWVMNHETSKIDGVPDEVATDSTFAPERRLLDNKEFFAQFQTRKFEFAAEFGPEAAQPFEDLWKVRLEINWAVDGMLQNKEVRGQRDADSRATWLSWYNVAFRPAKEEDDAILKRIKNAVRDMEATCRPAIDAVHSG